MEISQMTQKNPWWRETGSIEEDRDLRRRGLSKINWEPRLKFFFKFDEDAIYTMRGPRQVGKTTLVKAIMKDLLDKDVEGKRIFLWACDLVNGPKELASILESYLEWARAFTRERLFIFLDEVSSVKDWQKGIKYLVDAGMLENCTVILTGSHSLDIRKASERLPGRRGAVSQVLDKVLLPMKFAEYVDVRSKKIQSVVRSLNLRPSENRQRVILELAKGKIPNEVQALYLYSSELSRLFDDYLITGGIAPAIDAYVAKGSIPHGVYETYISVMLGDAMRWQKKEVYMAQIIRRIIESLCSQVSWQALCKGTDLGSHHTVAEYVDVLESSFIISCIYRLDKNKGVPVFEKDKKIHFQDPFIFHALRGWASSLPFYEKSLEFLSDPQDYAKVVESVVCNHLIRLAFNLSPSSDYEYVNKITYWESKFKREVDFAVKFDSTFLPVEAKCQADFKKGDLLGLYGFMKTGSSLKGIMITKDRLKIEKDIVFIPHYLFLALI
jgi:predicted AAA+ superfamily ATPase